jgi:hypothetical protein
MLAIPARNSPSEAIILVAVVAASPGTTRLERTINSLKIAGINLIRNVSPKTLPQISGDVPTVRVVI